MRISDWSSDVCSSDLFVLHEGAADWDSTLRINAALAVSTSRDVLEMIAAGKGPAQYVLMLGFSGWGPGQLEDELADNAWLTVPADNELQIGRASCRERVCQ